MKTTDIFKFVMLRPVQTVDEFTLNYRFLYPSVSSRILDRLQDTGSDTHTLAAEFMNSDNFIKDFKSRGGVLEKLGLLNNAIKRHSTITTERYMQLVNENFPTFPAKSTLTKLEKDLWDSLYASVIKIQNFNQDRADIIAALRLVDVLTTEGFSSLSNHELRLKLKTKAVIPTELFREQPSSTTPDSGNDQNQNNEHPDQEVIDRIGTLKEQLIDLNDLKAAVEFEERRRVKSYKGNAVVIENTPENPINIERNVRIKALSFQEVDDGNALLQLDAEAINRLGPKNNKLLETLRVDPTIDDTRFITQKIDETIKNNIDELYQNFGLRTTQIVGKGATSVGASKNTQFKIAQPGNESGIKDPFSNYQHLHDSGTEIPYPNQYDNSIANSLGTLKPLGMGDLLVVKETLLKYDLGEIAHIENVLESEAKERVHRRLDRTEETFTTSTESTEETERDLQTTDRYELQRETQKTLESSSSFEAGSSISAKYGPVQMAADASYSTSSSKSEANSISSNYAKEIVDKTVSRLKESIKEEIIQKTLLEIEETNTHTFDNAHGHEEGSDPHNIVGIYRWVDKYHLAQVYNYGERLMMEFLVPEPAAMYIHSKLNQTSENITLEPPKPLEPDFSFESIKVNNYHTFVRDYQVQGVSTPPPQYTTIAIAIEQPMGEKPPFNDKEFFILTTKTDNSLQVPDGYVADYAYVYAAYTSLLKIDEAVQESEGKNDSFFSDEDWQFKIVVGKRVYDKKDGITYNTMNEEDGAIPIAVRALNVVAYAFTVEVICKRTSQKLDDWRIETYNAIIDAYNTLKAAYDVEVKAAVSAATNDFGTNPLTKRAIEEEELQRGCITLLTNQHFKDFNAVRRETTSDFGYPEINVSDAMNESAYVKFFNQAFEWPQMTYHFYPYFWGNKTYWMDLINREDIDPDFEAFLRAGYARVVVPVSEGEAWVDAVLFYLETGEIWNGGESGVIGDPLYLSIVDEIKASDEAAGNPVPIDDETWEVVLPTSLVMLQEDSELPDYTEELIEEEPPAS